MWLPTTPFAPVTQLFLDAPSSEFLAFLQEAHRLVVREPSILAEIEADLDLHAKRKKAQRLEDARWREARSMDLPTIPNASGAIVPEDLCLGIGRPRMPAYLVYLFLVGRGYFGGYKQSRATTLLLESMTLWVVLSNLGCEMPGRSTLGENVNAVSVTTRSHIHDAQVRAVLDEGLDDFKTLLQDSTAVDGNTQWPTDSGLMLALVERLYRRGSKLDALGLPCWQVPRLAKLLGAISVLDREISMGTGGPQLRGRARRKLYRKLLSKATRAVELIAPAVRGTREAFSSLDVLPSVKARAARVVEWMETDVANLRQVAACCEARVVREEKVPASEKVLSVSDSDVGLIVKGGRDTVVGYKPQLARSGNGFLVGLIVPRGNASDSGQLVPMFDQVVACTGVVPDVVSVDDGYSSEEGRATLMLRGAKVVSINGSKGKHITPPEDWASEAYATARDDRSAVESLMFTMKHGFDFGEVARRGLENVHAELLEKALAYNFCMMSRRRSEALDAAA